MTNTVRILRWLRSGWAVFCLVSVVAAQTTKERGPGNAGPGSVIVMPELGGVILGFDVDRNGTEGVLSEANSSVPSCPYATETFDLATGKIVKLVHQGESGICGDDDVTWGVVGASVGLVEHQHSPQLGHLRMSFPVIAPVGGNQYTGSWNIGTDMAEILAVSRNQGTAVNAFQLWNFSDEKQYVFGSYVAGNRFGPVMQATVTPGLIGLNTKTNTAVLAQGSSDPFGPTTVVQADLATGRMTSFQGIGSGIAQGLAVDSTDNIAAIATYGDAAVTFYDLSTGGIISYQILPNCFTPACSPFDVEFDPIHKLFLVAQPITSQSGNQSSTIYVYDRKGDLQEVMNGFNFYTERFDVLPVHIAIHPSDRTGYVDLTNDLGVGALQSFTY